MSGFVLNAVLVSLDQLGKFAGGKNIHNAKTTAAKVSLIMQP